jgi:hypothetical protein
VHDFVRGTGRGAALSPLRVTTGTGDVAARPPHVRCLRSSRRALLYVPRGVLMYISLFRVALA